MVKEKQIIAVTPWMNHEGKTMTDKELELLKVEIEHDIERERLNELQKKETE